MCVCVGVKKNWDENEWCSFAPDDSDDDFALKIVVTPSRNFQESELTSPSLSNHRKEKKNDRKKESGGENKK